MRPSSAILAFALLGLPLALPVAASAAAKPDDARTFADLKGRAARGDAPSQWAVATAYRTGAYGLTADPAEAFKWASKAADGGSADAALAVAHAYAKGDGVTADAAQAVDWLQKAAQGGNATAAFELAQLYNSGTGGVTRDLIKADTLYQAAADLGDRDVFSRLCADETKPDASTEAWTRAVDHCRKAGQAGDAGAWYTLAMAYASGTGLPADPAKALDNYRNAANGGLLKAMETLAEGYANGTLASKDNSQAYLWRRMAARYGSMSAISAMAKQLETGDGVTADAPEAARLYDILARNGDADAKAWFAANPMTTMAAIERNIITPQKISPGQILYAVDSDDPRFQTLDLASYFQQLADSITPPRAVQDGVGGTATTECRFTADGDLDDCILTAETPKDYGFGPALVRIADRLSQSGNKTQWAARYAGKSLRLSARWTK